MTHKGAFYYHYYENYLYRQNVEYIAQGSIPVKNRILTLVSIGNSISPFFLARPRPAVCKCCFGGRIRAQTKAGKYL